MSGHSLDRPFACGEGFNASEADADVLVGVQPKQACGNGSVAAAPATGDDVAPGVVAGRVEAAGKVKVADALFVVVHECGNRRRIARRRTRRSRRSGPQAQTDLPRVSDNRPISGAELVPIGVPVRSSRSERQPEVDSGDGQDCRRWRLPRAADPPPKRRPYWNSHTSPDRQG